MLEQQKAGRQDAPSPEAARRVKGTLFAARLRYLRSVGTDVFERVIGRMAEEDQQALRGMILPSSWYPADLLQRLESNAAAVLAQGDRRTLFVEMGRFTAQTNLGPTGVQRAYVRAGDPHFLLANVPRMYMTQHSEGTRSYEKLGERGAVIRSTLNDPPRAEDCMTTIGWLSRAIECAGGRDVKVDEKACRSNGHPHCEFHCRWT
jgi:uncharacterized protein (TIGR02265 family)